MYESMYSHLLALMFLMRRLCIEMFVGIFERLVRRYQTGLLPHGQRSSARPVLRTFISEASLLNSVLLYLLSFDVFTHFMYMLSAWLFV